MTIAAITIIISEHLSLFIMYSQVCEYHESVHCFHYSTMFGIECRANTQKIIAQESCGFLLDANKTNKGNYVLYTCNGSIIN